MMLRGRNVVIYGAGNEMGSAVARAFAREGASVFLAGRSRDRLEPVAEQIRAAGGCAEVSVVDPLDEASVEDHVSYIVNEHGSLDASVNLAFRGAETDPRLTGLSESEFAAAAFTRVRSNFITSTAAARKMAYQGRGLILTLAGAPERSRRFTTTVSDAAIEALSEHLAVEVGGRGVRVACLTSNLSAPHLGAAGEAVRMLADPARSAGPGDDPAPPEVMRESRLSNRTYSVGSSIARASV